MRYLTRRALKMDKSSLKSGYIRGSALHRISGKSNFGNRIHSFMDGPALPVPILVGLHFIEAVIDVDSLIHASGCSTERPDLQRTFAISKPLIGSLQRRNQRRTVRGGSVYRGTKLR